jgi:hypothetical protein
MESRPSRRRHHEPPSASSVTQHVLQGSLDVQVQADVAYSADGHIRFHLGPVFFVLKGREATLSARELTDKLAPVIDELYPGPGRGASAPAPRGPPAGGPRQPQPRPRQRHRARLPPLSRRHLTQPSREDLPAMPAVSYLCRLGYHRWCLNPSCQCEHHGKEDEEQPPPQPPSPARLERDSAGIFRPTALSVRSVQVREEAQPPYGSAAGSRVAWNAGSSVRPTLRSCSASPGDLRAAIGPEVRVGASQPRWERFGHVRRGHSACRTGQ